VREAIRELAASGVVVLTIASDILYVPRVAYVGIDNRAAGRLAGYLLRRFVGAERPAEAALFAGSLAYPRPRGARDRLSPSAWPRKRQIYASFELREMGDDEERAYVEAGSLLDAYPRLRRRSTTSGPATRGSRARLKERGREHEVTFNRPRVVGRK